jgi:hypothetical protein
MGMPIRLAEELEINFAIDSLRCEAARLGAYDLLRDDLLRGEFEEWGESRVLFLNPDFRVPMTTERVPRLARRVTREGLRAAIETHSPKLIRSQYLAHFWIPRRMFNRWLKKHDLPPSPALFKPTTHSYSGQGDCRHEVACGTSEA